VATILAGKIALERLEMTCSRAPANSMNTSSSDYLPIQRVPLSLTHLRSAALVGGGRMACDQFHALTGLVCNGLQEVLSLSDDLLLVRSDFSMPPRPTLRWEIDNRGWLYLHCRFEGLSEDETPDGVRHSLSSGTFLLSASPQRPLVREVLTDTWRTVTIAFRPSFAMRDLSVPGSTLPTELRRFSAGDDNVEFWYASSLTSDMKSAVRSLLHPAINSPVRSVYLRAKVVELVCLALEQVGQPAPDAQSTFKLSHRDMRSLEQARRLLDEGGESRSLEALAKQVGLNRRKLALGFKHLFGVTVGDYDREVRLELARRLLEGSSSSVGYAAAIAGYSDVGSFTKAFKLRYGSLPSDLKSGGLRPSQSNATPKNK